VATDFLRLHPAFGVFAVIAFAMMGQTGAVAKPGDTMERLPPGVWIEGPGFEVTYGKTYEWCAARCSETAKCVMIEWYRPETKCNLYSTVRPRKTGGSSIVAIKKASARATEVGSLPAAGVPDAPDQSPRLVKEPTLLHSSDRKSLGR
jgi:hypothetical protein